MRGILLSLALLAACRGAPSQTVDGAGASDALDAAGGPRLVLRFDHTFGREGELPTHLLPAGPDRLLALTDRAIYRLDHDGRELSRQALPVASSGSVATLTSAAWDGSGLGAAVRWGHDAVTPAGSYLALTDQQGDFAPSAMLALGSAGAAVRVSWDAASQRHRVLVAQTAGNQLVLSQWRVPRVGQVSSETLLTGLDPSTTVGDWLGASDRPALCSVRDRRVRLHVFPDGGTAKAADLTDPQRQAVGSCRLASSGRSHLVTWVQKALPPGELDAGSTARPDLGPISLSYDVPLVQLVDPDGQALPRSIRLTLYEGPAVSHGALWDGQRYLVLVQTAFRGGRLQLAALDEAGGLLLRELELPLVYEPGTLLEARLAVGAAGDYLVLYAIRRPDDEGVLHLAGFALVP